MSEDHTAPDPWRIPLLLLWHLVFLIGLAPELVFLALRKAGAVTTFAAMVNSPAMITIALASYVALFVWRQCRDDGLSTGDAAGKAFQFGLFALVAFMVASFRWDGPGLLVLLWHIRQIPLESLQLVVFAMGFAKLTAWLYLFVLFFRYLALGDQGVFTRAASIFPSSYLRQEAQPSKRPVYEEREL